QLSFYRGGRTMALARWQPFSSPVWNTLRELQHEMNQVFDRWGEDGRRLLGMAAYPAVNVWEDPDYVFVEAQLPGLDLKDLSIYVTGGNQLTLKGERKQVTPDKGVWYRQERSFGQFSRSLTLPVNVDADKVQARFMNGVLTIELGKHEST